MLPRRVTFSSDHTNRRNKRHDIWWVQMVNITVSMKKSRPNKINISRALHKEKFRMRPVFPVVAARYVAAPPLANARDC